MNAAILDELTNNADTWFAQFMAEFERNWNARPATEEFELDDETLQILMEQPNGEESKVYGSGRG